MADELTATLAAIRDRGYRNGATGAECARLSDAAADDVPVLLAAVEAVLKAADDFDFEASRQERGAGLSAASGGMIIPAGQRGRAETHRDCARTLREAIRAALAGTGLSEDEKHG